MSTLQKTGRALKTGLALALGAVFALGSGCAPADPGDDSAQASDDPVGATEEAITQGLYRCTMAGMTILGTLVVKLDGTCSRIQTVLPGASGLYCPGGACPSCWTLARDLGCILTN